MVHITLIKTVNVRKGLSTVAQSRQTPHFFANTALSIASILVFPVTYEEILFTFNGPFFFIILNFFAD